MGGSGRWGRCTAWWLEGSIRFDGEEGRRAEEAEDGVWMRRERKTIVPGLNSPSATWFHPVINGRAAFGGAP